MRPVVVLTDSAEIESAKTLVGAAITTQFTRPLMDDEVAIPFNKAGTCVTRLIKECVAKCSWLCEFEKDEIIELKGVVPPHLLQQILAKVSGI